MIFILLIESTLSQLFVNTIGDRESIINNCNVSIANFGYIPFGQNLQGAIYLPPIREQNKSLKLDEIQMCEGYEINKYDSYFTYLQNKWIILNKGNCSQTQQAINAQQLGAKLLIIVNDNDENNIQLYDDGNGYQVKITVIMISKQNGQKLIDKLLQEYPYGMLSAYVKFPQLQEKENINLIIGINIAERQSLEFISSIKPIYDQLKEYITINIFYEIFRCEQCKKAQYTYEHPDCIQKGRYCQVDPDGDKEGTGAILVKESLRQQCLWLNNKKYWWRYIDYFRTQCTTPIYYENCFKLFITDNLYDEIMKCYNFEQDTIINILEEQIIQKKSTGIIYYPGITINGKLYRGDNNPNELHSFYIFLIIIQLIQTVLLALCRSLTKDLQDQCLQSQYQQKQPQKSHFWLLFVVLIMSFLFILFMVYVFREVIKNQQRSELQRNVEETITRYRLYYDQ